MAAIILGLGRALGEAIAVTQVIGNFIPLKLSLFEPGDTLASRIANQYQGATTNIQIASLDLPRLDPARDHVRHELHRAAHREAVRARSGRADDRCRARDLAPARRAAPAVACGSTASPSSRRSSPRCIAIAVLGDPRLVGVQRAASSALNWDFFTKGPAVFGETGRRHRARARRHGASSSRPRRRWRCRSAC